MVRVNLVGRLPTTFVFHIQAAEFFVVVVAKVSVADFRARSRLECFVHLPKLLVLLKLVD